MFKITKPILVSVWRLTAQPCSWPDLLRFFEGLCEWSVPQGGLFLWMKAIGVEDTWNLFMKKGLESNVMVVPGRAFATDPKFQVWRKFLPFEQIFFLFFCVLEVLKYYTLDWQLKFFQPPPPFCRRAQTGPQPLSTWHCNQFWRMAALTKPSVFVTYALVDTFLITEVN